MTPTSYPRPPRRLSVLLIASSAACLLGLAASEGDRRPADGWTRPHEDRAGDPDRFSGQPTPFLLTRTDARAIVTGPVAHTVVRQQWENPNREPVEGLYIFPLPDNAAVTAMRLQVGARRIDAEIRRREEARALYDRARAEGRVAGLLDQERPNIFAQRVANLMPGTRIEVTIEFDQEIRCDDGDCAYVLPTVVGPRFIPCRQGDAGEIAPPVAAPDRGTGQRLDFSLDLDAGLPVRDLRSPSHRMRIEAERSGRATLRRAEADGGHLDRDVEVRWRLGGADPEFGVLAWRDPRDGEAPGVFTLFLQPPVGAEEDRLAVPRELVFVLDCSGSMSGTPIEAAKNVVRASLRAARPGDTLQIIRFSDRASGLGASPVPVTPANVRRALEYLDTLHGEGGTEMLSGIRAALDRPADPERLRIVAFLTDGYIGNEAEILGEVRRLIGPARLFSFGIGSSVNRYLLENLAQEGRGAAAFLGPRETPDALVARFVERIATPVFTDLRLSWEGLEVEDLEPAAVPDLFAGQPLVIHGRYRRPGAGGLVLEGRLRGRREVLRRAVTLPAYAADHEALGRLWARARIERLTRETYGRPHPDTITAVTDLGLRFHLMTPYTSLLAVDQDVSNPGGESATVGVPVELPEGVSYQGIFGQPVLAEARAPAEALRSLGYVGAPRAGIAGNVASQKSEDGAGGPVAPPTPRSDAGPHEALPHGEPEFAFRQIVLVEEDGTRRTIEDDGEAWLADATRRRLVRTLTADRLADLRAALQAADAGHWAAGDATFARGRSRLVILLAGGTARSVALPARDPGVRALADLIRAATS